MKAQGMPGGAAGLLAGALLSAAIISIFFAGWRLAGLPFVPFDVFDLSTRVLPGRVIGFGISTMVAVIRALDLGPTASVAKAAEQSMGVAGLFITGALGGAVLFVLLRAFRGRHSYLAGIIMGCAIGIPAMFVSFLTGRTAGVPPAAGALWVLAVFLVWGAALGWVFRRLAASGAALAAPVELEPAPQRYAERISRRKFMVRLAGVTATITVSGAVVGALSGRGERPMPIGARRWSGTHALPNADAKILPAPGTRDEFTPLEKHYRIDINTMPPSIDISRWRLKVSGLVEKPLSLGMEDLKRYEPEHLLITLSCISNPIGGDLIGTTRWTGVSLKRLVSDFRLKPDATHLKIKSADGFWEVVPLESIKSDERIMLAYEWDGVPLLREHGFPLRIFIPDRYGMKQPKWIESIEATGSWEEGFWVVRGWDKDARMKATSVIDTIAVDNARTGPGGEKLVPVGGIAHAGARGISKVEVRVDDGPWRQAELRTPMSQLTWVVWRSDLPFQPGRHRLAVRCFEGDGTPQVETPAPPDPSGATGLHSRSARF